MPSRPAAKLILMTAQPSESWVPRRRWAPDESRQLAANYTIEDVLSLPDGAPRVELTDGVLLVPPSPSLGHQDIGNLLWMWFRQNAPRSHRPATAVGVVVTVKDTFEPDVVLLKEPVASMHHYFQPDQVALAVEVVSPGTKRRDRFEKPGAYASVGIPHYWRIEQNPVHVYAYDLEPGGSYQLIADSDTELVLSRPFEIRLPIEAITG
jgi:Uma2 family endonuclease